MSNNIRNKTFYDNVSEFYNEMVNFDNALENKKKHLTNFLSNKTKTAADIGCGSGIDSIALSSLGFNVTGFDASSKMIEKAKINSKEKKEKIKFYNYSAQNIPYEFNGKFDFICSLGNTIANISPYNLKLTVQRFSELLNKKGRLLFHILNYEKIINDNERIINIKKGKDDFIIRFYDFKKNYINFNILKFEIDKPKHKSLLTTKVYPHKIDTIKKLLKENNFTNIKTYSDLAKTKFSLQTSKDIYLFCSKK